MPHKKPDSIIAQWKNNFPKRDTESGASENGACQDYPKPEGAVLNFYKKAPVTFQLNRRDSPDDFELMGFVIKAVDKSGDRPYKTVLHIEQTRTGSRLVASDGCRLHFAEITKKIKSGEYKPVATKDSIMLGEPVEGIAYPEWAKEIPEKTKKCGVIDLAKSSLGHNKKETENLSLAFNAFVKQTGGLVNLRYLEDLPKTEWEVYSQNDKTKPIVLRQSAKNKGDSKGKGPMALIMQLSEAA